MFLFNCCLMLPPVHTPRIVVLLFYTVRRICGKVAIPSVSFNRGCYIIFATKTLPPSLRIIVALLFVASAASALLHRYPSSESVLGGRFWVLFCIFGIVLLPHLRQLTFPRPPSASPLVGTQLSEIDCCLSMRHKHIAPPPQVDITTPPTTKDPSPHRLNIHSMPHYCKEDRRR